MDSFKIENSIYRRYVKRVLDILISLVSIIVLCPIIVLISIAVKIKLGSPIIFRQNRPGMNEKVFTMYKFRTMTNEIDGKGEILSDSRRVTKFGKILRATSLDELPELYNVLIGDMSIIGPRPLLIKYLPYYRENEKLRHSVRPGLSGLAQINGRNNLCWDNRLKLDVEYVHKMSFLLDVRIIMRTLVKVVKRENVSVAGETPLQNLDIERGEKIEN